MFARARRSADRFFTVLYRESNRDEPRIGFTVAKKKIPTAVGRNRVRRIARESFRQQNRTLGGIDIIILAQHNAAQATNKELFASLDMHWDKLARREDQASRQRRSKDINKSMDNLRIILWGLFATFIFIAWIS